MNLAQKLQKEIDELCNRNNPLTKVTYDQTKKKKRKKPTDRHPDSQQDK